MAFVRNDSKTTYRKRCRKTTGASLGVWLASISLGFWMRGEAKGLPAEVPRGRSFRKAYRQKPLKVRVTFRRSGREAELNIFNFF